MQIWTVRMTTEIVLKRIREERIRKGISLRVMAEMLSVSGQYLSMIERGMSPLKWTIILRYVTFYR